MKYWTELDSKMARASLRSSDSGPVSFAASSFSAMSRRARSIASTQASYSSSLLARNVVARPELSLAARAVAHPVSVGAYRKASKAYASLTSHALISCERHLGTDPP